MKMSSCGRGLEGGFVAQHRPQNVDPPASQCDQSLGVLLPLSPLAVVESPGVRRRAQAGERRLVEDSLEDLVAATHPAALAGAFAGVTGRRDQPGVSGELVGALKDSEVPHGHQELGPEDRTHPRQASEDPSLGTGEKTLLELLIQGLDTLLERERFFGELGDDPAGDAFSWQPDTTLCSCGGESLPGEGVCSLDAAVLGKALRRRWPARRIC